MFQALDLWILGFRGSRILYPYSSLFLFLSNILELADIVAHLRTALHIFVCSLKLAEGLLVLAEFSSLYGRRPRR